MPRPTRPPPGRNVPTPVPQRSDRANFAVRGDATQTAMPGVVDDINTNVAYVNDALEYVEQQVGASQQAVADAGVRRDEAEAARDQSRTARDESKAWATTALNAPGASGTSSTSLTLSAGTKNLTTQTGKNFPAAGGVPVAIVRQSAPNAAQLLGMLISYNGTTGAMVADIPVTGVVGTGTFSDWTVSLTGPRGAAGQLPDVLHTTSGPAVKGARNLIGAAGITVTLPASWAPGDAIEFAEAIGDGALYTLAFGSTPLRGRTVGTQMLSAAAGSSGVLRYYDATRGLV